MKGSGRDLLEEVFAFGVACLGLVGGKESKWRECASANIEEELHLSDTDESAILRKKYPVGRTLNLPGDAAADEESHRVSIQPSQQSISCLTCEKCGGLLGSGKDRLESVICASAAGMVTVIQAVGFWYETRHFCRECRVKGAAKPLRI